MSGSRSYGALVAHSRDIIMHSTRICGKQPVLVADTLNMQCSQALSVFLLVWFSGMILWVAFNWQRLKLIYWHWVLGRELRCSPCH